MDTISTENTTENCCELFYKKNLLGPFFGDFPSLDVAYRVNYQNFRFVLSKLNPISAESGVVAFTRKSRPCCSFL
jgi:hypothetical protein